MFTSRTSSILGKKFVPSVRTCFLENPVFIIRATYLMKSKFGNSDPAMDMADFPNICSIDNNILGRWF